MVFFWNEMITDDLHQITLTIDTKNQPPKTNIMNTPSRLSFYLLFIFLLIFSNTFSQKGDPVVITLVVDITQLGDDPNNPGGCIFMAEPNSVVLINPNPKDFTVHIDNGKKIKWIGRTTDGDVVKILKIYYQNGTNVFNKTNLRRCLFGKKVRNKVRRLTAENMDYTYGVKFKVKKKGKYSLDPKIRVK